MPTRLIREGILTSEPVNSLNWAEEVFYRRLLSVVDDFGRFYASPKLLRAACYPLHIDKVSDSDIGKWLAACATAALVRVYPAEDGKSYIEVQRFNQQVRAKTSKFPQPPAIDIACVADAKQVITDAHLDVSVSGVVSEVVKPAAQAFVLPDWIPEDTWVAFMETRKAKKAKSTVYALNLVVKTLEEIRAAGHDPIAAINNSIKGGWSDVYAPKQQGFTKPAPNATVPGKAERDPELVKAEQDAKNRAPMPDAIRELAARLKTNTQGAAA